MIEKIIFVSKTDNFVKLFVPKTDDFIKLFVPKTDNLLNYLLKLWYTLNGDTNEKTNLSKSTRMEKKY